MTIAEICEYYVEKAAQKDADEYIIQCLLNVLVVRQAFNLMDS